jgi:cellulose synthase operon protein YhjQ
MDTRGIKLENEVPAAETPEDVAILYSWANLQGAKYRDFSASRREYRAQIRHRAALTLQERELQAAANAEAAAAAAERAAQAAEDAARRADPNDSQVRRLQILRNAEAAARKAAAERMEAARRVEAAAEAESAARREEAEIAEAHASAERQALAYTESDMRRRRMAGPQPRGGGAQTGDPYSPATKVSDEEAYKHIETEKFEPESEPYSPSSDSSAKRHSARVSIYEQPLKRRPQGYHPDEASGVWQIKRVVNGEFVEGPASRNLVPVSEWLTPEQLSQPASDAPLVIDPIPTAKLNVPAPTFSTEAPLDPEPVHTAAPANEGTATRFAEAAAVAAIPVVVAEELRTPVPEAKPTAAPEPESEPVGPAWLFSTQAPARPRVVAQPISHPSSSSFRMAAATQAAAAATFPLGTDTLQDSRERVASRWFALKGVFEHADPELPTLPPIRLSDADTDTRAPLLAVFSVAGGVGKTSLVATLGRALSSLGEKVLLADTTSHGLLPFYFGARELRPGVVRTFSPPSGSSDAPIHLVSYDIDGKGTDVQAQDKLAEDILQSSPGNNRIIVDLSPNASWMIRRIAALHPTVLVPIAPDMNSVISLQSVEKLFQSVTDADGRAVRPFYLLNQFDATLALHLDVREVFRRQLGDRLLRFAIHRSPAVSEALAEGMTVVDYAPDAPVSQDYLDVAAWLRSVSPPATAGFRNIRWSER